MTNTEACCGRAPERAGRAQHPVRPVRLVGRSSALAMPALLLALLPKCPLCWSAYGAVLSALGMSGLYRSSVWPPLLVVGLCVALVAVARSARRIGERRVAWLGSGAVATASLGLVVGRDDLVIAGSVAFVGAVGWLVGCELERTRRTRASRSTEVARRA